MPSPRSSEIPPTAFGPAHFVLWGIPVRVAPWFWLTAIFLGGNGGPRALATWTVVVFVSVMLHEMGHALVARAFGAKPAITLHGLGGLTQFDIPLSRLAHGLVSLAGPAAGLVFGGLVYLATRHTQPSAAAKDVIDVVLWVNIGWGLVNLLPVLPFDGGQIVAALLGPKHSLATAIISVLIGTAVAAAGYFWLGSVWIAFLFGSAALSSVRRVRLGWSEFLDARDGLAERLERARRELDGGDAEQARTLAHEVALGARGLTMRNAAWKVVAWAHLAKQQGGLAREALMQIAPPAAVDPYTLAAVMDAAGESRQARDLLEAARRQGLVTRDASKLLVDLYARAGQMDRAAELAAEAATVLGEEDAHAVLTAAVADGRFRPAASLAGRLFELWHDPKDALDQARALALAGERMASLEALERLLAPPSHESSASRVSRATLENDPAFQSLAGDERFLSILAAFDRA